MSLPETIPVSCYTAMSAPLDAQSRADTVSDRPLPVGHYSAVAHFLLSLQGRKTNQGQVQPGMLDLP
jgi:hypothetical protein